MSRSWTTNGAATKAIVLAAGLGVSMALGAGVSSAADSQPHETGLEPVRTAEQFAEAAQKQADAHRDFVKKEREAKKHEAEKKAKDEARKARAWKKPISGKYELSASFGNSGGRWAHKHSGQDFAVPVGTPVHAVHKGTVVKAGGNGAGDGPAYGNAIVIRHSNGTYSQYAHLKGVKVKPGQQVKTDQKIGVSGNTGNSSGPHLHFEIRKTPNYGSGVEPKKELRTHGVHV